MIMALVSDYPSDVWMETIPGPLIQSDEMGYGVVLKF